MTTTTTKVPPVAVVRAAAALRQATTRAAQAMAPAPVVMLDFLFSPVRVHLVGAAAELGIADQLAGGEKTSAQLAAAAGATEERIARLMRALAGFGIFAAADGKWRLTKLGATLRSDAPVSLRSLARFVTSPEHTSSWAECVASVRSDRTGFGIAHGKEFFDFLAGAPALAELFAGAMASVTAIDAPAVAAACPAQGEVCDVAGGTGLLLTEILARNPQSTGVLFDVESVRPAAIARLEAAGMSGRCRFVAGNFFESVPAGADVYVLKNILHDWADDAASKILRVVRKAMTPGKRLLVVEMALVADDALHAPAALLDMEMQVLVGGKQRTPGEFDALFAATGFRRTRIIPLPSPVSIVEAAAV